MDRAIHKNSAVVLSAVFLLSFWAFWPDYLSGALTQVDWRVHFHAITLSLWCVLMVMQAYLIRSNRRSIHRQTGKLSYLLAPLVVIASLIAVHNFLGREALAAYEPYLLAFVLGLVAQFVFAYALAIYHRRNPVIHARFMICTALPMVPPILDRIMLYYQALRTRMRERHPEVVWPVEYRSLAADDAWLSPAYERDTVTLSVHQDGRLPFEDFFADVEPILAGVGGRPHWGKVHTLGQRELQARYPRFDAFCERRQQLDPKGRFLNDHLREIFAL